MIIPRKGEAQRINSNGIEEDQQQSLSTLRLQSYTSQKSQTSSSKARITVKCQNQRKVIVAIVAIIVIAGFILYFSNKCSLPLALYSIKNKEILQIDIQERDLSIKIKQAQQQINQHSEKNKILNYKIHELEELIAKNNGAGNENNKSSNLNLISIQYGNYQPLPINPLRIIDGKKIANFLYKDEPKVKSRGDFIQQRISFINSKESFPNLFLAKYNFVKNEQMLKEGIAQNEKDWLRLQKRFQISSVKQELQFCVVVPSYNNNANFRIEGNLNSIFTQNYTNYKVVIVNDGSTDNAGEIYKQYFKFYKIDKSKYVYIQNPKRVTALQNIYYASIGKCSKESIIMVLDGDDEFIGRNVLKTFNWGFQSKRAGVLYSNFYWYQQPVTLRYGFTQQYTPNEKNNNLYRGVPMKFSQLRAFRNQLLHQMNVKDLQDQKGVFYTIAYDMAIFLPIMELSCGRVEKLQGQFHYLYNVGTGLNDDYLNRGKQLEVDRRVRGQKKYDCYKQFNQRMKK